MEDKNEGGRPTKYTQDLADQICDKIATSNRGLAFICKELNIAPSSVYKWLSEISEFSELYARARETQAEFLADEILEIADDNSGDIKIIIGKNGEKIEVENTEFVNRSRLKVDSRKWIASKLKPKKYGDKVDLTSGGDKLNSIANLNPEELKMLLELKSKAEGGNKSS